MFKSESVMQTKKKKKSEKNTMSWKQIRVVNSSHKAYALQKKANTTVTEANEENEVETPA